MTPHRISSSLPQWLMATLLGALLTACGGQDPVLGPPVGVGATSLVSLTNPADLASGVCPLGAINATFGQPMLAQSLNTSTFTIQLAGPPPGPALSGSVSYDATSHVATLTPSTALAMSTRYSVTVSTGATTLAGVALNASHTWTFTTGNQACANVTPVALGTAAQFGVVGGGAGSTNTATLTVINNGGLATTATSTSSLTGFHDSGNDVYTEVIGTNQGNVTGKILTCTVSTSGPTSAAVNATSCAAATQAKADAQTAFDGSAPAAIPGGVDPGAGQLGGLTLVPGTYAAAGGAFLLTGSDLTLDAQGNPAAVWVFQTASSLTIGAPGAPRSIILINGAQAKNVFWHVGSAATINAAGGGTMVGTVMASAAVAFSTVGNALVTALNGRAESLNASVTMTNTVITVPGP